jgi:NTP pyrophosphatase (non-canonical NTP hydrolase)
LNPAPYLTTITHKGDSRSSTRRNRATYNYGVDLNDYQRAALRTAAPRDKHNELFHLLLGLVGETGEIAEKAKKIVRDRDSDFSTWDREDLKKELGDTLWYVAVIADHFGLGLAEVAEANIAKLADRQRRGVLGGAGDDR